jgi:hypothetical protein
MDQDLLRRPLREARAGQRSTTCASLPPELLASILEYGFPNDHNQHCDDWDGSWLGSLLLMGCTSSSFLESLKYVARLEIDICYRRWPKTIGEHESMLPARYDAAVRRWCDIASRRLRHVRVVRECGGCNTFNPVQTKSIVDCAASFPNLQEFEIDAGEAVATCMSVAANVRAGRFRNLRRLNLDCGQGDTSTLTWHEPATFNARRMAKFAFEDLISQLPPDRGIDVLVRGQYPWLMEIGDEDGWDQWVSIFFDLVAKGADVRSRPILGEIAHFIASAHVGLRSQRRFEVFYSIVERLLSVHGVDPNCPYTRPNDPYRYPLEENEPSTRPPLWMIMCAVDDFCAEFEDFDNGGDPDAREPMFRPFMRTLDLLVRHGARSSDPGSDARSGELGPSEYYDYMNAWICTRRDCTPQILAATQRGDLAFDWPRRPGD